MTQPLYYLTAIADNNYAYECYACQKLIEPTIKHALINNTLHLCTHCYHSRAAQHQTIIQQLQESASRHQEIPQITHINTGLNEWQYNRIDNTYRYRYRSIKPILIIPVNKIHKIAQQLDEAEKRLQTKLPPCLDCELKQIH